MHELVKREGREYALANDVLSFLEADRCKIVYRISRKRNIQGHAERADERAKGSSLFLLEYDRDHEYPSVIEYPNEPIYKSFSPLLSPDGNRILYNHTFRATDIMILPIEGEPVKVAVGANPHWVQDKDSGNMYIVYRNENGKFQNIPQDGITYRLQIDSNNQPVGEPEIVATFGFGGGMSTNGQYLCTAYLLPVALDRKTGAISAPLGTVRSKPHNENQCCCPSIAPDDTGRMMLLRWPHVRISIMGWDGSEKRHYPLPEGGDEWQTPEWSTHPDFFTGSIMNKDLIYDIVIARVKDEKYLQITKDGGYIHAHLWVG
ncbi:MAG: hypothetical protein PVI26_03030 [Chitinispirillia bacterium]|jgi:hypothetical protein